VGAAEAALGAGVGADATHPAPSSTQHRRQKQQRVALGLLVQCLESCADGARSAQMQELLQASQELVEATQPLPGEEEQMEEGGAEVEEEEEEEEAVVGLPGVDDTMSFSDGSQSSLDRSARRACSCSGAETSPQPQQQRQSAGDPFSQGVGVLPSMPATGAPGARGGAPPCAAAAAASSPAPSVATSEILLDAAG
jgi:hypothetical protein